MRRLVSALVITLVTALALPVAAQDDAAGDEVKRDPKGQKGISPYNEDLAKGRVAFEAKDYPGALTHFDAAIQKDADKMMAYILKAQTQLQNGEADSALTTADTGRAKQGTEGQQAKMLFLLADVEERKADTKPGVDADAKGGLQAALQGKWEKVKGVWDGYVAYIAAHSRVPDYKASAEDRKTKIDQRVKRDKDYGAVKVLIAKNQAERDKKKK